MIRSLPALFISHGPPTLPLEDLPVCDFLRGLAQDLAQDLPQELRQEAAGGLGAHPKAILAISAHWEAARPTVTTRGTQAAIHDFYGFPDALYRLRYGPPGDPVLAARVRDLLDAAGLRAAADSERGLDHGVWTPLTLMYPAADIPVVQLSLAVGGGASDHRAIGEALAPLRDEGVLIVATGNLTHNLREWQRMAATGRSDVPDWVSGFQDWVADRVAAGDGAALCRFAEHPDGRRNHPTDEHFLPFFVALGAGGLDGARRLHDSVYTGVLAMDAYAFGEGPT